ncbi:MULTISPECIES: hypothetical protein [Streptomyces]|uniref:hypothetical protein n=1 Tax=Streptomyces TaxID=1883 RepID=UPI0006EB8C8C|nr:MULTISPECIES: hypothetical protein [Streptomyces]
MSDPQRADETDEVYARVQSAVAARTGTEYRLRRTERGFDLVADVPQTSRYTTQVHTYRVVLSPREKTFVMTDIVVTEQHGPGPARGRTVTTGRSRYRTWSRSLDGSESHRFAAVDGHRLIRGVTAPLGWEEIKPTGQQAARVFGIIGGAVALGTLIALAVVFWT